MNKIWKQEENKPDKKLNQWRTIKDEILPQSSETEPLTAIGIRRKLQEKYKYPLSYQAIGYYVSSLKNVKTTQKQLNYKMTTAYYVEEDN